MAPPADVGGAFLLRLKVGLNKHFPYVILTPNAFLPYKEYQTMKRIKTLTNRTMKNTMVKGGCGECQTSCQSACKTSCTVGNQSCENTENK